MASPVALGHAMGKVGKAKPSEIFCIRRYIAYANAKSWLCAIVTSTQIYPILIVLSSVFSYLTRLLYTNKILSYGHCPILIALCLLPYACYPALCPHNITIDHLLQKQLTTYSLPTLSKYRDFVLLLELKSLNFISLKVSKLGI